MDVISISDSTSDGSTEIRSMLFHYSTESSPKLNEELSLSEKCISLSSESTERCPVTWRTKQKKKIKLMKNIVCDKTPSATTKVENWLTDNKTKSNFNTLHLEALNGSTVLRLEPLERGGSILIQHNCKKDLISYVNAKPCYLSRKIFSAKKGVQNLDSDVISLDSDSCSNKSTSDDCNNKNQKVDISNNNPSDDKSTDKILQKKSKQKTAGEPLSPESQKKNELCSYLQLMNMNSTDKKIGSIIQNRRSIRVQNLNMLSERKKLEKELRSDGTEAKPSIVIEGEIHENDKELAKKSFDELKINISEKNNENDKSIKTKADNNIKNTTKKTDFLCVSSLPRKVLECSVDFDEAMKMFIDVEKIPIPKLTSHRFNMNGIKLKEKKKHSDNPENPSKNKMKHIVPRNLQKYRNLRSNQKLQSMKKKEKKEASLLRKKNSSSIFQRHKLLSSMKANRKLVRRKVSPNNTTVISNKVTNIPDVNAVQITVNKNMKNLETENSQVQNLSSERNVVSQQKKKDGVLYLPKKKLEEHRKPKDNKVISKTVKAFREKNFCIIDLSHQHDYKSSETLLDHNYASKPKIDKNYIMNMILGQPFVANTEEKKQENVAVTDAQIVITDANKVTDVLKKSSPKQILPSNLKINGQQTLAVKEKEIVKKNKITVAPIEFNFSDFSDELNVDAKNEIFNDKMSLTVNEKPSVNIFEDPAYLKSPVTLTDTCMKESSGNLENEAVSSIDGYPITHYIPFNSKLETKPLHKSLTRCKRKLLLRGADAGDSTWDDKLSGVKRRDDNKSHSIQISKSHGIIFNAFYLDFNLIVAQEQVISFWSQSALGNMLGAQNMWISKGSVQRLVTEGNCIFKKSSQAVISLENSVAYVELWIKEHKSDKRERPVADIFATIYFCRHHLNGPDKKVLQLENINGIASDVQYVVLRNSRNIIVSWCETYDDSRKTHTHCYNLASDYQTVVSIREMGNVDHYIKSLHIIEDCDMLVMGYGEHKVSLWNVEYGYVVATIEINDIRSEPSTLWVKCDRGFLFMLQFYELENMFKLIAINGIHHSWKQLKMFTFPSGYKGLYGVCLDNNILGAFYSNGIMCWNIQTGQSVIEEICSEHVYIPSEKHIIILSQNGILVRHTLSHLITNYGL